MHGQLLAPLILSLAIIATGCAPLFQDARLVARGTIEITPSVNGAGIADEGESEYLLNAFGAQAQVGVHERLNLGVGYGRFEPRHMLAGMNGVAFGPRISIVRDRVAIALPVSFAFGQDLDVGDTWQIHPAALFTVPVSPRIDVNPSVRLLIPLCAACDFGDVLVGLGAGLGVHTGARLTLRPEVGILVNPGETGVVWTFGLGVSIRNR